MGIIYLAIAISFLVLFSVNLIFVLVNLYVWATNGLQFLLKGENFTERVYQSVYLKWIILADVVWIGAGVAFMLVRKNYKTDLNLHYLSYNPIINPKICVVMFAYNEEQAVEKTVKDFISQKNVEEVIVIDNHSTDRTVELARRGGAKVIIKESNKGYAHSWVMGLKESLKTSADIIVTVDVDGTYNGADLSKMVPYLDNCDMVIGSRMIQVLTEKGNQNSLFHVWGNRFIAFLFQLKYFSLQHIGAVQLTDVGCAYFCMRKESLSKIIHMFTYQDSDRLLPFANNYVIHLLTLGLAMKNNLKIVEIPITFNKRLGVSKTGTVKKSKALEYGFNYIWFILRS